MTSGSFSSVAWSGTEFVVVSRGGTVMTSMDGMNWRKQVIDGYPNFSDVIATDTGFVAVGDCLVSVSRDGLSWPINRLPGPRCGLKSIAKNGAALVAVANGGAVFVSQDGGVTWSQGDSGTVSDLVRVVSDGSQFVAVTSLGFTLQSADGLAWSRELPLNNGLLNWTLVWNGTNYVGLGRTSALVSANGSDWRELGPSFGALRSDYSNKSISGIAWNGAQYVASQQDALLSSSDALTWTETFDAFGYSHPLSKAIWDGEKFLALADQGYRGSQGLVVMTSLDGITWQKYETGMFAGELNAVASSGAIYVAVGGFPSTTVFTSVDTRAWASQSVPDVGTLLDVVWGAAGFVAIGYQGIIRSTDGVNWEVVYSGANVDAAIWTGSQYVVVGYEGILLTSSDAVTWRRTVIDPADPSQLQFRSLLGIAWNGRQYLTTGTDDGIYASSDGVVWSRQDSKTHGLDINSVVWDGQRFVASASLNGSSTVLIGTEAPDLVVNASQDPVLVDAGSPLSLNFRVSNDSFVSAMATRFVYTIPKRVTVLSVTTSSGSCTQRAKVVTCNVGTIAEGSTVDIAISTVADKGTYINEATVSSSARDANFLNNYARQISTFGNTDVSVTGSMSPALATLGSSFQQVYTVTNHSNFAATGVIFTAPSAEYASVTVTDPAARCSKQPDGLAVTCALGDISPSDSVRVVLDVTPQQEGLVRTTASVKALEPDSELTNNAAELSTEVGRTEMSVAENNIPPNLSIGDVFSREFTIKNDSRFSASGSVLYYTLPENVRLESASSNQGSCTVSGRVLLCSLGTIAGGETYTVQLTFTVVSEGVIAGAATMVIHEVESTLNNTVTGWAATAGAELVRHYLPGNKWAVVNPTPTYEDLHSVAFHGGIYVAVGQNGVLLTSQDAKTWVTQSTLINDSARRETFTAVRWINGQFVVLGASGTVLTSTDGSTWTKHHVGRYFPLRDIAWNGQLYVSVGNDAVITSADGENWSSESRIPGGMSIVWDGVRFVIATRGGSIWTSSDGSAWAEQADGARYVLNKIVWTGKEYIAGGWTFVASNDLHIWREQTEPLGREIHDIAFNGERQVAVGDSGVFFRDSTGQWQSAEFHGATLSGITWDGARFVGVGKMGSVWSSSDGMSWRSLGTVYTRQAINGFAEGAGLIVAVGDAATVLTSTDGVAWTRREINTDADLKAVVWGAGQFIAVGKWSLADGDKTSVYTSVDGISWETRPTNLVGRTFSNILWDGSRYVAVSCDGTVITSTDGANWASQVMDVATAAWQRCGLNWNGVQYVFTGGSGRLLTSQDAIHWEQQTTHVGGDIYAVAWSGSRYVAVGQGGLIITSPDGKAWLPQSAPNSDDLGGVVWSGSRFIAAGPGVTIASLDGVVWDPEVRFHDGRTYQSFSAFELHTVSWLRDRYFVAGTNGVALSSAEWPALVIEPATTDVTEKPPTIEIPIPDGGGGGGGAVDGLFLLVLFTSIFGAHVVRLDCRSCDPIRRSHGSMGNCGRRDGSGPPSTRAHSAGPIGC